MQRLRSSAIKLYPHRLANKTSLTASFGVPPLPERPSLGLSYHPPLGCRPFSDRFPFLIKNMSVPTCSASTKPVLPENIVQQVELLSSVDDLYGGVIVNMEKPMVSGEFATSLKASILQWKQQGKRGVWIKLPLKQVNLVESAVKEGFRYHHAEPNYLMLVHWISKTTDTLPANASHRVGIGAFVMNNQREVLVVLEKSGKFKKTEVWKLPTGVVNEGEDICRAAVREVKEETGIDTEFVEMLAFRESHKSFFSKSDLFFVCMLRPCSLDIQKQDTEIEAAQWMPIEEYAAQPFIQKNELFNYVAKICLAKADKEYAGFSPVSTATASGKTSNLYCNNLKQLATSGNKL